MRLGSGEGVWIEGGCRAPLGGDRAVLDELTAAAVGPAPGALFVESRAGVECEAASVRPASISLRMPAREFANCSEPAKARAISTSPT